MKIAIQTFSFEMVGELEARRKVVLVVEDEALLRANAVELAEAAGFEVVEAGGADEAIAILERRTDIRIVFTDIQMPGSMDGLKLARFIRTRWPPIELIVTSGRIDVASDDLPDRCVFVPKPYQHDDVVRTMQRLAA